MYIRHKQIKGHTYFYLVESERHGKKVVQKFIGYLGRRGGRVWVDSTVRATQERTPTGLEALAREALKYKSAEEFVKKIWEGVVLEQKSLPDMLRSPMADLGEARRSGTFQEIERAKKLVEKNVHALNRELRSKPLGLHYQLSNAGKVIFSASDITTMTQSYYQPKILGKYVLLIKPSEAEEFISKIEEQVRERAIDPLVAAEKIQILKEVRSRYTLANFYKQVRQKMSG